MEGYLSGAAGLRYMLHVWERRAMPVAVGRGGGWVDGVGGWGRGMRPMLSRGQWGWGWGWFPGDKMERSGAGACWGQR